MTQPRRLWSAPACLIPSEFFCSRGSATSICKIWTTYWPSHLITEKAIGVEAKHPSLQNRRLPAHNAHFRVLLQLGQVGPHQQKWRQVARGRFATGKFLSSRMVQKISWSVAPCIVRICRVTKPWTDTSWIVESQKGKTLTSVDDVISTPWKPPQQHQRMNRGWNMWDMLELTYVG